MDKIIYSGTKSDKFDTIIVDEVFLSQMKHLRYLYREWFKKNKQIILIGDENQCVLWDEMRGFDKHPFFLLLVGYKKFYLRHLTSLTLPLLSQ